MSDGRHLDSGTPPDLLPSGGTVAVGRAEYRSVILTELPDTDPERALAALDGPVDLGAAQPTPYEHVATGVIVTTEQEWTPKKVGLGRLLHSLSLAPGESTRVAIVDWSRRSEGASTEATGQTEQLAEESARARGVSEITEALASEEQHGFAEMRSRSVSASGGGSVGFLGWGASASSSTNTGVATNVSRSSGRRQTSAQTAQRINERTRQLATATRDRRASIVKEISEAERSAASTRVVTNYNHMHALTIQYWEMVQAYTVTTRTKTIERCLFIPMKVMHFNSAVLRRYAPVLASVAPPQWADRIAAMHQADPNVYLTRTSGSADAEVVEVPMGRPSITLLHFAYTPDGRFSESLRNVEWKDWRRARFWGVSAGDRGLRKMVLWDSATRTWTPTGNVRCNYAKEGTEGTNSEEWHYSDPDDPAGFKRGLTCWKKGGKWGPAPFNSSGEYTDAGVTYHWTAGGVPTMSIPVERVAARSDLPVAAESIEVWWDDEGIRGVQIEMRGAEAPAQKIGAQDGAQHGKMVFAEDERLRRITLWTSIEHKNLRRIGVTTMAAADEQIFGPKVTASDAEDQTTLDTEDGTLCGLFGTHYDGHVYSLGFRVKGVSLDVIEHVNDNALHYSRAIWANADESTFASVLARYSSPEGGAPLGLELDPNPIAMTANYLAFRWHFSDSHKRLDWLKEQARARYREGETFDDAYEAASGAFVTQDDEIGWLEREAGVTEVAVVALPTDGVFAEAVLGRSNGAEKIDHTRFWDWKDSDIPIKPPEIGAVDTGSRRGGFDVETARLEETAAAIHALTQLPEPADVSAALQAIATANMFRDMSGRDALGGVLQAGINAAATADQAAAKNATEAMKVAGENITKAMKVAAEIAPMAMGPAGAAGGLLGGLSSSKLGGLINLGLGASAGDGSSPTDDGTKESTSKPSSGSR